MKNIIKYDSCENDKKLKDNDNLDKLNIMTIDIKKLLSELENIGNEKEKDDFIKNYSRIREQIKLVDSILNDDNVCNPNKFESKTISELFEIIELCENKIFDSDNLTIGELKYLTSVCNVLEKKLMMILWTLLKLNKKLIIIHNTFILYIHIYYNKFSMDESKILIIDNSKFYWDSVNNCLIPYELVENQNIKKSESNNYLDHSLNLYNQTIKNNNHNYHNNDDNKDNNIDDNNYEWYMENYDIDFWENILSRPLDSDEKKLFHQIWNENSLNIDIKMLQKSIIKNHCYIKSITTNVGNCLFESLGSLDLGDNDLNIKPSEMIRKNLASLLLAVKTEIGFFPNLPDLTPEEIFTNYNEIEFVKDSKTKTAYIYDYDMMIYDLVSNYSWTRLPTEFLLMAISRIYQVEILIYHNKSNFVNKINVWNNILDTNCIKKIRLGLINEEHYFPLLELSDDLKYNQDVIDEIIKTDIKYDDSIKKFKKWSKVMMDSMNDTENYNIKKSHDNFNDCDNNYHNFNISKNKIDLLDNNYFLTNNKIDYKIMKTNKQLTQEQIDDYNQISNFDEFRYM